MRILTKALLIGSAIEAALAGAFAAGGFGPCGPSNILGFIGMMGHLFPGFLVIGTLSALGPGLVPDALAISTIVFVQGAFWSALAFVGLSILQRR